MANVEPFNMTPKRTFYMQDLPGSWSRELRAQINASEQIDADFHCLGLSFNRLLSSFSENWQKGRDKKGTGVTNEVPTMC